MARSSVAPRSAIPDADRQTVALGHRPSESEVKMNSAGYGRLSAFGTWLRKSGALASVLSVSAVIAVWRIAAIILNSAFILAAPPAVIHRFVTLATTPSE